MRFTEILRLAFASLGANKLRSALTMLGISVGVFSVIGVMTVISGLRAQIETGMSTLGANTFQIDKFPAVTRNNGDRSNYANRRDIDYAQANRFKELMGEATPVCLQISRGGITAAYLDRKTNPNVQLIGTDENYTASLDYAVATGRTLDPGDVDLGRPVCVLGFDVALSLFSEENPLGHIVRLNGQNYTVIGTLAAKGSAFGSSRDNFVLTPISRWLQIYSRAGRSIKVSVQAANAIALNAAQDQAIGAMRLVRGLKPEDGNDFEIASNDSLIAAFNEIAGVVAIGAFVISAIALVASGVGVMNIMLVSVTERTREIGIRKSIGARRRSVLVQFLLEAVALSLIGGLAGVAAGVAGGNIGALIFHYDLIFPWGWALTGLLVCGFIGVTFGLYPAWKASNLDPIEALRFE
ncbi:MAG: ABC transporter permease [Verrucomicrobiota bacterium]